MSRETAGSDERAEHDSCALTDEEQNMCGVPGCPVRGCGLGTVTPWLRIDARTSFSSSNGKVGGTALRPIATCRPHTRPSPPLLCSYISRSPLTSPCRTARCASCSCFACRDGRLCGGRLARARLLCRACGSGAISECIVHSCWDLRSLRRRQEHRVDRGARQHCR